MTDKKEITRRISTRERLVCWLILLMVRILAPWQYEHEFKAVLKEIETILGSGGQEE